MVNFVPKLVTNDSKSPEVHTVESVMSYKFDHLTTDMGLGEALDIFVKSSLNGLPVLDKKKNAVGYLSEKDCLKAALATRYLNHEAGVVSDYMFKGCQTVKIGSTIHDVATMFISNWYHNYPVINSRGTIIGVVTRKAVLAEIAKIAKTSW